MAEGADIEADVVTMSSYYIESAQNQSNMFLDLTFDVNTTDAYPPIMHPSWRTRER